MRRPNLTSCLAIAVLLLALASVTIARVIYIDADASGANNAGGANGDTAVTVTASALKDIYDLGEQVPLVVTIVNYSAQPVYIYVDEHGFLRRTITVKDKDGVTIAGGPAATPPPPPRYYWVEIDGQKVFVVPVKEIGPGQTVTAVIPDALRGYHGHLQEGTYYLTPRDMSVIHDVGFIMERNDVPHPLWIDPSTVISKAKYKVNTVQIWLRRAIIYVDADATGANDGSSWADAYNYLQDALADANSAEKPFEIRVAQGVYKPDLGKNQMPGDREATFQLINDVAIRGGCAGFGEPDPNARDIEKYKTILSGDLADNDVDVNRPCDLLTEPSREENSYHVLIGNGCDEKAVLDGITVSAGNANRDFAQEYVRAGNREFIPPPRFDPKKWGGGMYNDGGSPMITNCTFSSNSSQYGGGSLYNRARSSPTLVNCTFNGNQAGRSGGGIHNCGYSDPTLTNCTFSENSAGWSGGGMHNEDSSPRLINCAFIANSAIEKYGRGGGMDNYVSNPILTNCTFSGNSAGWRGGGVVNTGPSSNTTLTDCTFSQNSASNDGGGMYSSNSVRLTLTNCTFSGNLAGNLGGGMYNGSGEARLTNCMLSENSATWGGGVCHNGYGRSTLANCTISNNRADRHGGGICSGGADLTVINCILWGDTATQGHEIALLPYDICYPDGCIPYASSITVSYSDVQVGSVGVYVEPGSTLNWGVGNIDADPNFADIVDGDYHLKSQAGWWNTKTQSWVKDDVTSPCIDAGDMSSPIGYEPFPNGGIVNMGAYGGTAEASKSYFGSPICETIIASDINGDCRVNFKDFALMAAHWLEDNTPINSDSVVKEGIEYYICTDKSVYHLRENVQILYRVTNLREVSVDVGDVPNCAHGWSDLTITDERATDIWQHLRSIPPCGWTMLHLEPYDSEEHQFTWDMISDNGTFGVPDDDYLVGAGSYEITGQLRLSNPYKHKRVPVSVSIEIRP